MFCIGDSTTAGLNSPYDKTYPAVLDSFVKEQGYRCINAGVGGYRSIHELLYFKKRILPWKPWGITIFSGYNDFICPAYGLAEPHNPFKHSFSYNMAKNRMENVINQSVLLHFWKVLGYKLSRKKYYKSAKNINKDTKSLIRRKDLKDALGQTSWLNEWRENISQVINLCRQHNIKCYLLSHPSPTYKDASLEAKNFAETDLNMDGRFDILVDYIDLIHKTTEDLCKETGAKFINFTKSFDEHCLDNNGKIDYKKRFLLFNDKMHLSNEGNFLFGKSVYEKIREDL